ncbi:hypothetical protein MNBD_BACTEROID05-981 [hydrothermal vent metagenome]|uniref:Uncharacterized protein n=1 Tax=hydrothermal vent metagenome TaxID=652676 RepID=A0A3B0T3X1_9ZZZZ
MIRNIFFTVVFFVLISAVVYAQDTQQLVGQALRVYTGSDGSSNGLIAGFSIGGLVAGLLFGSIGFIAFFYGKKRSEFRPLLIGIALMVYPYFLRQTIVLWIVGAGLTVALYFFRE